VTPGNDSAERAVEGFRTLHGTSPSGVWSAPGRVNLIGEHTDYNNGFVLPFALPHRIAVAAAPRTDGCLGITTIGDDGLPQRAEPVAVADLEPGRVTGWSAYPSGVAWVLRDAVPEAVANGADLVITGNVPAGAGLSSSHALQSAVALALLGLAKIEMDTDGAPERTTVARWVQRSENDFVGAPTGLLDQTASLCCTPRHALFLDVRSFEMRQVPFDAAEHDLEVLVIDTRAHHSLGDSAYGERRAGCERAAKLLTVDSLRDVEPDGMDEALAALPEELKPLVRHVVTENARVHETVRLLDDGRYAEIGAPLTASHASLRDDYRVSVVELDVAVEAAIGAGALGARMTGGGFGGSAIALVPLDRHDEVSDAVAGAFAEHRFGTPRLFTAAPSAGAGRDC
jgi:galactokinase